MNPNNKHPNLDSSSPQARADRSERPGRQIDGIPSFGVLRLFNCLESTARRIVGWISRWHQRRTGIRKLKALNDHYLKDIGRDRPEIVSYVEGIIVMDTRSKYKADKYNPNKYWNRSGSHEIHGESIGSTEKNPV